ncbi:hypothetical protein C8Q80DRAFT_1123398 [Daedaleopsis nitida]|nr:hypothetical protein C8Q80DRAFT_1123398 [Daedaleopsis nitida]
MPDLQPMVEKACMKGHVVRVFPATLKVDMATVKLFKDLDSVRSISCTQCARDSKTCCGSGRIPKHRHGHTTLLKFSMSNCTPPGSKWRPPFTEKVLSNKRKGGSTKKAKTNVKVLRSGKASKCTESASVASSSRAVCKRAAVASVQRKSKASRATHYTPVYVDDLAHDEATNEAEEDNAEDETEDNAVNNAVDVEMEDNSDGQGDKVMVGADVQDVDADGDETMTEATGQRIVVLLQSLIDINSRHVTAEGTLADINHKRLAVEETLLELKCSKFQSSSAEALSNP